MKIIVAFVLVAIIFTPSTVFGWRSINEVDIKCIVDCNSEYGSIDSSKPMNFIMLGMLLLVGLGLFIKYKKLGKYYEKLQADYLRTPSTNRKQKTKKKKKN